MVVLSLTHDVGDEGKNTFMLSKLLADAASLPELPNECSSFNPEDVAMIIWYGKSPFSKSRIFLCLSVQDVRNYRPPQGHPDQVQDAAELPPPRLLPRG